MLSGTESYKTVTSLQVDILFFSSQSLDDEGIISDSTEEENYLRSLMIQSAKKAVFLCDSAKFHTHSLYTLARLEDIDVAIFDKPYDM